MGSVLAFGEEDLDTIFGREGDGAEVLHLDRRVQRDAILLQDHKGRHLDLVVGQVEAKTPSGPAVEGQELIGPNTLGAVIRPPVRVEHQAVLTPQRHQPVQGVGLVQDIRPSVDLIAQREGGNVEGNE